MKPKFKSHVAMATKAAILAAVATVSFAAGVHDHTMNQELYYDSDSGKLVSSYAGREDEYNIDLPVPEGYYTMEEALSLYKEYKESKYNEIMSALYEEFNSSETLCAYYDEKGNMHVSYK